MLQSSHPFMMRKDFRPSLTLITALLVLTIAGLAGISLWALRSLHGRLAHAVAARSVLDEGRAIASYLAHQPVVREGDGESGWGHFSTLVGSIHTFEHGLQYVSVKRDGVTVFHEQTSTPDESVSGYEDVPITNLPDARLTMGRELLTTDSNAMPVVTFAVEFKGDDGAPRSIEVALKKETVNREEIAAAAAIESMFKLSLLIIGIAFGICLLLVVWMMRRETIREMQRREEEHLVFAGVLANGIVHDFRNPMSSMRLDIQMLQKEAAKSGDSKNDRVAQLSHRILATMDRLDKVFQEFFYLSKPGTDAEERIDLAVCIRECVGIMAVSLEQAGVKVELDLAEPAPCVVASPAFLRRAIINLITNARQFSKSGDVITIHLFTLAGHAIIDVIDNGPGVPVSERSRIFEMFVTTRPGGTGLGLFLAKRAVERSGGTIKVMDRLEGGSCFRISLPFAG
jgi:signal transduction histidine kinase